MFAMAEPHASEFQRLIRLGAGARDIHDEEAREQGFARRTPPSDAFVAREQGRVDTHRRSSCAVLEAFAGRAERILDVGCSTGGSTVAMALSPVLAPTVIVGVDPDPLSLRAAEVRAKAYGLDPRRIAFVRSRPGEALPFASDLFDLVVCVSVLEFLPTADARAAILSDMKRVTRPGGHLFVSTPNPLRLRDVHARRWLGDLRRRRGYPWATPPWELCKLLSDMQRVPIDGWVLRQQLRRAGIRLAPAVPDTLARALGWAHAWQKVLVRKPGRSAATYAAPIIA